MVRAGIFIGVDKTGNLQQLSDAAAGAQRMHDWAIAQGMVSPNQARLITDLEGKKVTADQIYDAIKEIIDGPGADQLILYFAGHGVNINRSERWLLSDAPARTSAAVNLAGSVDAARYCGIGHVVVISDSCRVAPEGIQAQNVQGVEIFPNDGGGRAEPVDQFFACLLGRTAAEIGDAALAAAHFRALYTTVLLRALKGEVPELLERSSLAGDPALYVRPLLLESYLEKAVPREVRSLGLEKKVKQDPDAILSAKLARYPNSNWISKIEAPLSPPPFAPRPEGRPPSPAPPSPAPQPPENVRIASVKLVQSALYGPNQLAGEITRVTAADFPEVQSLLGTVQQLVTPFGPEHFETQCGIKVQGTEIVEYTMQGPRAQPLGKTLLRIDLGQGAMSVVLRFKGDFGTVIPAIAGFVAALTVQDGELVDVAYEPSTNNWRWNEFERRASEIRALRAVAASATQHGRFRLNQEGAFNIAQKMQYAKSIDPTLAVYAAYAYHDLEETERIQRMAGYQRDDLGVNFFDLALLGRDLVNKSVTGRQSQVVPFVPLFSQGWALLSANRVRLHPALETIQGNMHESVWSLFDPSGVEMLRRAVLSGEVL